MRIHELLRIAVDREASDLHIVAGIPPSIRVDGEIQFLDEEALSPDDTAAIIGEMLNVSQMDRLTRDRELDISFQERSLGRFRTSLYYSKAAMGASFRVVPERLRSVKDLNLPKVVDQLSSKSSGLVLITGPTGVGKTTTMNAIIDLINTERRARIITIEDPIEFVHEHRNSVIIQREVSSDTNSFRNALVAALRQDPNVLCVGEMRDLETIATALTAAETGHLVISTLHTTNASQTIDRIIDVFPAHQHSQIRQQFAAVIQGIISQQLLPRASGRGRVLAYEVLVATPATRSLIREAKIPQIPNVISTSREEGMILMDRCLRNLYEEGYITYDSALTHCHDPATFKAMGMLGAKADATGGPLKDLPIGRKRPV